MGDRFIGVNLRTVGDVEYIDVVVMSVDEAGDTAVEHHAGCPAREREWLAGEARAAMPPDLAEEVIAAVAEKCGV